MAAFRLTGEKFIKYVAGVIAAVFFLFALVTVVVELLKPTDSIKKIVHEKCETVTQFGLGEYDSTIEESIEGLTLATISNDSSQCQLVLFPAIITDVFDHLSYRKPVKNRDYLSLSDNAVLLVKSERNIKPYADAVYNCVRKGKCEMDTLPNRRDIIPFTVTFFGKKKRPLVSISFTEFAFADAVKRAQKTLDAMIKTKNLSADSLEFRVYFHGSYALVGSKKLSWVTKRFKREQDGFYLKSRGAKLRAMPWEMVKGNLFKSIKKKARQYGLKKDDFQSEKSISYLQNFFNTFF